jgi:hypothetical protein
MCTSGLRSEQHYDPLGGPSELGKHIVLVYACIAERSDLGYTQHKRYECLSEKSGLG